MNNLKSYLIFLCTIFSLSMQATEVKLLDKVPTETLPVAVANINKSYCIINEPVNLVIDLVIDGYLSQNPKISYPDITGGELLHNNPDSFSYSIKDGNKSASVKRVELKFYGKKQGVIVIPRIKIELKYRNFAGKNKTTAIRTKAKAIMCHLPKVLRTQNDYLVANSVKIEEQWEISENIDYGSVITQHLTIKSTGQLARFIPTPYLIDEGSVRVIAYEPKLTNLMERGELRSEGTFVFDYTITGRGKIILQTAPLAWWDPVSNSLQQLKFSEQVLQVPYSTTAKALFILVFICGAFCLFKLWKFQNSRFIVKAKRALKKNEHCKLQNLVYEQLETVGILLKSELETPQLNQFLDGTYLKNNDSSKLNGKTKRVIKRELRLLARTKK